MVKKKLLLFIFAILLILPVVFSANDGGPLRAYIIQQSIQQQEFGRGPESAKILVGLDRGELATIGTFLSLLIIITVVWFVKFQNNKKNKNYRTIGIVIVVVWVLSLIGSQQQEVKEVNFVNWTDSYDELLSRDKVGNEYLAETDYYDYKNPKVKEIITILKERSTSALDYTQQVLDYVFINVPYDFQATDQDCFIATTSLALDRKKGDCDIEGITIIGLLRGAGIASRPVGGCLSRERFCNIQFAVGGKRVPLYHPITKEDLKKIELGRSQELGSRRGGLHLWVEAYLPDSLGKGRWVILEPTTGEIIDDQGCFNYDIELYPSNLDKRHICISTDVEYALWCSQR